jgi:16S rRNA (uracil1498-N3)-methyltransferase
VVTIHRFFVPGSLAGGVVALPERVAHQATAVLRLRPGDPVVLFDGRGGEWAAELRSAGRDVSARLLEQRFPLREPAQRITLGQAMLKADRFEWVLQKGTELGVAAFQPLLTRRTVPGGGGRRERWRRIVIEAAEQCGRCVVPEVAEPAPLEDVLARPAPTVLLWENEQRQGFPAALAAARARAAGGEAVRLLVGPEGGFHPDEAHAALEAGAFPGSLGPRILRSETAALAAASLSCLCSPGPARPEGDPVAEPASGPDPARVA